MGIEEFLLDQAKQEGRELVVQEGKELGVQEGKDLAKLELVKDHLLKGQFSPEQMAEIFGVPIALVLSIQEDLRAGDKIV